jgi:hypothetical protein
MCTLFHFVPRTRRMQRQHVADILVGPHDDHAAGGAVDAAQAKMSAPRFRSAQKTFS